MKTGNSEFTYETEGTLSKHVQRRPETVARVQPGSGGLYLPERVQHHSFGLGGIEYTKIKQKDADGNEIGQRTASKMRFRLNLLNIRIGVTVHLWNKKANKA